jgi:threonine/homoserine/homoserine lactone efflux protein
MNFVVIVLSAVIGLVTVAPLGPVNIIVIRAALRRGLPAGLLAGSGSVAGDGIFAAIAAYGVRWIEDMVMAYALPLQVGCGLLLAIMGVRTARRAALSAAKLEEPLKFRNAALAFLATFGLTLANPATLMGFLALFGSLSHYLNLSAAPYRPAVAVLGVMLGSLAWWCCLSFLTARLKHRLTTQVLARINRWAGIVIAGFGFALLSHAAV